MDKVRIPPPPVANRRSNRDVNYLFGDPADFCAGVDPAYNGGDQAPPKFKEEFVRKYLQ
jgi:hypothetical protein